MMRDYVANAKVNESLKYLPSCSLGCTMGANAMNGLLEMPLELTSKENKKITVLRLCRRWHPHCGIITPLFFRGGESKTR